MESLFIGVVAHKSFKMQQMEGYFPVFVGNNSSELKKSYLGTAYSDRNGESVYELNPYYSELTAQYWISKNITDASYKGIVHYRRFLTDKKGMYLTKEKILETMDTYPVIMSKKVFSRYTIYNTYARFHNIEDLETVRLVISEKYPDYIPAFDKIMRQHGYHSLNILIAKSELFDEYTEWLFSILTDAQKRIIIPDDDYQKRVFGFLSERLLDVWIETKNVDYKEFTISMIDKNKSNNVMKKIKQTIYSSVFRS